MKFNGASLVLLIVALCSLASATRDCDDERSPLQELVRGASQMRAESRQMEPKLRCTTFTDRLLEDGHNLGVIGRPSDNSSRSRWESFAKIIALFEAKAKCLRSSSIKSGDSGLMGLIAFMSECHSEMESSSGENSQMQNQLLIENLKNEIKRLSHDNEILTGKLLEGERAILERDAIIKRITERLISRKSQQTDNRILGSNEIKTLTAESAPRKRPSASGDALAVLRPNRVYHDRRQHSADR